MNEFHYLILVFESQTSILTFHIYFAGSFFYIDLVKASYAKGY